MAEISAKIVMELRGRTGAGMMDCKKALAAVEGDMEKAIDYLREKGLAAAAKKQSRIAAEGLVGSLRLQGVRHRRPRRSQLRNRLRGQDRQVQGTLVADVAEQVVPRRIPPTWKRCSSSPSSRTNPPPSSRWSPPPPPRSARRSPSAASCATRAASWKATSTWAARSACWCRPSGTPNEEVIHDVALQIAAASPVAPEYVRREEVDPSHLEHEKEILIAQARNEGKPEKIIEKMVAGPHRQVLQGGLPPRAGVRQGCGHQRAAR